MPGVRVVAAGPRLALYTRVGPPADPPAAGLRRSACSSHLARRGRRYDVVHTASFPYFSLLAAGFAAARGGFRLVVDWHELWTRAYWRDYLGRVGGLGRLAGAAGVRADPAAGVLLLAPARRAPAAEGLRGEVTVLEGEYAGAEADAQVEPYVDPELVVFAGRHIPEKRVPSLVPAIAPRASRPELRAEIYGDGPEREQVLALIRSHGLEGRVAAPGFVDHEQVDAALRRALCLVLPSRREGYGLVVVEACAAGTPASSSPTPTTRRPS